MSTLADRMRAARVLANLSQGELADRLGVGLATIQRREYGRSQPSAEALIALAQATGVPLAWLVDGFTDEQIGEPLEQVLKRLHEAGPRVIPDPPPGGLLPS